MNLVEALGHFQEIMAEYDHLPRPSLIQLAGKDFDSFSLSFSCFGSSKFPLQGVKDMCTWANAFHGFCHLWHGTLTSNIEMQGHAVRLMAHIAGAEERELRDHDIIVLENTVVTPSWLLSVLNADEQTARIDT